LVAGFVTEYSGVRYLVFFMVEWGNLYIIGALATTLFLGGWQIPAFFGDGALATLLQFVTFFLKSYFWVLVAMWIRATLPRVRVDQLMSICWKYLVPMTLANMLCVALWMLAFPDALKRPVAWLMTLMGAAILVYFFKRVLFHLQRAQVRERNQLTLSPLS
jgi:NADH-quinone oxidoreductase subunit H